MSLKQKLCCQTLSCKMGFTVKSILRILEKKFSLENIDLTLEQYFLLNILNNEEGLILQDLSELLDRDKSAIARHLNGLEKKHFVARTTDPDDKRRKILLITKAGVQVLKEAQKLAKEVNREITRHISEEDLQQFEATLASIYECTNAETAC
ncbi:MarR family winged helix-turn-helix transcriptional regulator [Fodinibius sediminis]|uniref:DNA-binding transcriptional regulator, MarR family n=1 Tax=Fodinibius sediminis TaxID=1214077 RepID=A0A521ARR8_9BACT|nr:MarR family transcriptional regulator [Fodinibius sediminis]SMO37461.1 DNA-binding transcriptional regulator, MarR family [Fodinibius sediminis]